MKRLFALIAVALGLTAMIAGCGETVQGVSKDLNRQGNSIKTFFFREG